MGVIRSYPRWDDTRGAPAHVFCWYRAKGAMLDYIRFECQQDQTISLDIAAEGRSAALTGTDPYGVVLAAVTLEWVYSLCSPTERQVIDLYRRGLTFTEIANARGTSQTAVTKALRSIEHRARTAPLEPSPLPPRPFKRPQETTTMQPTQEPPAVKPPYLPSGLRPEHVQVLQDLANGQTLEQVAKRSYISRDALKSRLALIARRMGLPSARQIDLVVAAMRIGLIH